MKTTAFNKKFLVFVASIFLLQIHGCANEPTPRLDEKFGNAVRSARESQRVNQPAPASSSSIPGFDGAAAVNVMERYQESFKTPPSTFEVLNIGGAATGK